MLGLKRARQEQWWDKLEDVHRRTLAAIMVDVLGAGFGEPENDDLNRCFSVPVQAGTAVKSDTILALLLKVADIEVVPGWITCHFEQNKELSELQAVSRANAQARRGTIIQPRIDAAVPPEVRERLGRIMQTVFDAVAVTEDCEITKPGLGQYGLEARCKLCLGSELRALGRMMDEPFVLHFEKEAVRVCVTI